MATIPNFDEDLNIIGVLGDSPNTDNNLDASGLKRKFDAAGLAIQRFLNAHVVPAINNYIADNSGYLKAAGDTMLGILNMNYNRIANVGDPSADRDAVPKRYADKMLPLAGGTLTGPVNVQPPVIGTNPATKAYVDAFTVTATLAADGWAGDAAPYTQSVTVAGLTDLRRAMIFPVYMDDPAAAMALREACSCVSYARRNGSIVTFYCLEDKPEADIPILVEVGV